HPRVRQRGLTDIELIAQPPREKGKRLHQQFDLWIAGAPLVEPECRRGGRIALREYRRVAAKRGQLGVEVVGERRVGKPHFATPTELSSTTLNGIGQSAPPKSRNVPETRS